MSVHAAVVRNTCHVEFDNGPTICQVAYVPMLAGSASANLA